MAHESEYWPGWYVIRCIGCSGYGVTGVVGPHPCGECGQSGRIFLHEDSGMLVQYPGGPALGMVTNVNHWIHERPKKPHLAGNSFD